MAFPNLVGNHYSNIAGKDSLYYYLLSTCTLSVHRARGRSGKIPVSSTDQTKAEVAVNLHVPSRVKFISRCLKRRVKFLSRCLKRYLFVKKCLTGSVEKVWLR